MSEGFHPEKSRVNADSLADFIRAQLTGDLNEVPGVGAATIKILNENGISTTYQLLGKYLMLKEEGVEPVEHADRFYFWLKSINTPGGFRAGIVHSIAEKVNSTFVGLYDADAYQQL
mmetsp:Transcript_124052/g.243347  ORF Transcript_124052/g.243347 Transcript_124052/m.243347 type:complete len:117 (-) Transcript_124052:92-442(-)|eukprot:CAMPEP_0170355858 /NCGR_PEP_ID=MMETSP0117_2-20130122/866_1 /TAXON_ID=400756 /ORGANISM="Durinskia baltica, Strain CSIRO CS-38" /LENGTH=116 /DNA_ID=CAMNT_0010609923 /DNA_START=41 /DNA_END=391 /DNA_ORIENTATION=+